MASRFPETPCNADQGIGISGRWLFHSSGHRDGASDDRPENAGTQFLRIVPRPVAPAQLQKPQEAAKSEEPSKESSTMSDLLQKPVSKYNPPDFIGTIKVMREKLYKLSGRCTDVHEPPEDDRTLEKWKKATREEPWYTNDKVVITKFL